MSLAPERSADSGDGGKSLSPNLSVVSAHSNGDSDRNCPNSSAPVRSASVYVCKLEMSL